MSDTRDYFRRLLSSLWLRPERALWYAHELSTVSSFLGLNPARPFMEYGCLDGTNTFLMMGGDFSFDHDDFHDISGSDLDAGVADYFSSLKAIEAPVFTRKPQIKLDVGFSSQTAHLQRAARLDLYHRLEKIDLGGRVPLPDSRMETVWAPLLFWNDGDTVLVSLRELCRVLSPTGRIVTILPVQAQIEHELWSRFPSLPPDFVEQMDRGVAANLMSSACPDEEWRERFSRSGLRVARHRAFLPAIVGSIYQIGLRPMFPEFMKAYSILRERDIASWRSLKRTWIDTVEHFMGPLCDVPAGAPGSTMLWHAYELRRG